MLLMRRRCLESGRALSPILRTPNRGRSIRTIAIVAGHARTQPNIDAENAQQREDRRRRSPQLAHGSAAVVVARSGGKLGGSLRYHAPSISTPRKFTHDGIPKLRQYRNRIE